MSTSQSDLLAYALFDADPRAQQLKEPLLVFLASLVLFELRRPASRDEVFEAWKQQFPSGQSPTRGEFDAAIASAVRVGLLEKAEEGGIALPRGRRDQLAAAARGIESERQAFRATLTDAIEEELHEPLDETNRRLIISAVEEFIHRLFQAQSVSLARSFGPDGGGFDEDTSSMLTVKTLTSLASSITSARDKVRRLQIAEGIRHGLTELSGEGQRYLAAAYQKTVAFALLEQDPSVRRLKRDLASRRIGLLDTNLAMAFMFPEHPKHEDAKAAIDASMKVGCELRVSHFTAEELARQLQESDEHYERLSSLGELLTIVDDDILRTFAVAVQRSPGLTWKAFYAQYSPATAWLEEHGIQRDESDYGRVRFDERREDVRDEVRRVKPPRSPQALIDYDVDNLLLTQLLREQARADEMGNRVWFVTLDRALRNAEKRIVRRTIYRLPSSKRAAEWTDFLSPYLSPDDQELSEYALHLVQSQLGLVAEDPVFADINFLLTLDESPFDIDQLLTGDPSMTRRVIVALQEEQEVSALLNAEPSSPEDREAWADRLATVVRETLSQLEEQASQEGKLTEAEKARAESDRRAEVLQRERDESRRHAADLEDELEALRAGQPSLSLWERAKRLMPWRRGADR